MTMLRKVMPKIHMIEALIVGSSTTAASPSLSLVSVGVSSGTLRPLTGVRSISLPEAVSS